MFSTLTNIITLPVEALIDFIYTVQLSSFIPAVQFSVVIDILYWPVVGVPLTGVNRVIPLYTTIWLLLPSLPICGGVSCLFTEIENLFEFIPVVLSGGVSCLFTVIENLFEIILAIVFHQS